MNRVLIGSLVAVFLMASAPAMAERKGHYGAGVHPHQDRGSARSPGHPKKFLQAHYRRGHDHRQAHGRHQYHPRPWNRKHYHHHAPARRALGKRHKRDLYRYHRQHSGYSGIRLRYGAPLPPEVRLGRIIHDTRVLIESSRR